MGTFTNHIDSNLNNTVASLINDRRGMDNRTQAVLFSIAAQLEADGNADQLGRLVFLSSLTEEEQTEYGVLCSMAERNEAQNKRLSDMRGFKINSGSRKIFSYMKEVFPFIKWKSDTASVSGGSQEDRAPEFFDWASAYTFMEQNRWDYTTQNAKQTFDPDSVIDKVAASIKRQYKLLAEHCPLDEKTSKVRGSLETMLRSAAIDIPAVTWKDAEIETEKATSLVVSQAAASEVAAS